MSMSGTSHNTNVSQIKFFLRADTAEGLVRSQLELQTKLMAKASFTDIQFVEGQWYAWFEVDVNKFPQVAELTNTSVNDGDT